MCHEPATSNHGIVTGPLGSPGENGLYLDFFRNCFGELPDLVVVADDRDKVLFLNKSAQNLTGCCLSGDPELVCSDILRTKKEGASLAELCEAGQTCAPIIIDVKNQAGKWLPFSMSVQKIAGNGGKSTGFVAIMREAAPVHSEADKDFLANLFSSVINNFPIPFFTVDADLTVTYMNELLERLTGYSRTEVVGRMSCAEILRTPYCHTDGCLVKQSMEARKPIVGVRRVVVDREGREIPVAVHCSIITDQEDRVIGGFKAMRDITPLVEAEQKIRVVVEITPEGILMLDEGDRVTYANSKLAEIFGRSKDDLIGMNAAEFLPYQCLEVVHELAIKVEEGCEQASFCTINPSKSPGPEEFTFEICIVVARIGHGLTTFMYFQDLTKQIEIERQLFSANSFLQNIIMSSADGILVVDIEGRVLIFNESAERILGHCADELMDDPKGFERVVGADLTREIMRRLRHGGYGPPGKLPSTRIVLTAKDGEDVPVSLSAALIKNEDREIGTVGIFSDLREHVRILRELEDAKMQLLQAEKIASIGRLAAGVAHEINNPLSGILIYADMLQKEFEHNPQWTVDMQEIIDQTMRCKQIVTRLLDFSRQSAGQKVAYDMNKIITRSYELLMHQALFQDVQFIVELDPGIPWMVGDPCQLQQVFTNLLINAANAMRGQGKITITSRYDPESDEVILQFWDTGPGIPQEILNKLFEPFFTTKAPGEGTGLGLSVAYGIIQQHGGSIEGANSPSSGAVFTIMLPLECPEQNIAFA